MPFLSPVPTLRASAKAGPQRALDKINAVKKKDRLEKTSSFFMWSRFLIRRGFTQTKAEKTTDEKRREKTAAPGWCPGFSRMKRQAKLRGN